MAAWTSTNMACPIQVCPKISWASWASTVGYPVVRGVAWVVCASQEMPATRMPRMHPSATRTWRALRPSGGRNAPTASETASIPVSEAPPLAKARSRVKIITPLIRALSPAPMA